MFAVPAILPGHYALTELCAWYVLLHCPCSHGVLTIVSGINKLDCPHVSLTTQSSCCVPSFFGGAQIFYTVYDRWKEASMPKLARFMHFFNTIPACARRTERQTQGHSLYPSGSGHISVTDHSASCTGLVHLPSSSLCVQCPRAQSLARYCSFCTWRTSLTWWKNTASDSTPMRTTRSSPCISVVMNSHRPSNDLNGA